MIREAIIAACLTGLMILLFLGSWRSTLIIAISIPLSILTSIIVLSLLGETINIMTLGGLALAVGILVDDATVTIENIERYLEEGQELHDAILDGAAQIAVPALVSTLCICIVFLPMFFLSGVARYLFVPLAEAVVFAMLASYVLSRTLVPTLAMYLLQAQKQHGARTRNPLARFQRGFRTRLRTGARSLSSAADASGVSTSGSSFRYFCWPASAPSAGAVARAGLLPDTDTRPIHASYACEDRHAHRGDGAALRSGRSIHPAEDSRQASWTTSSTTSACPTARSTYAQHLRLDRRRRCAISWSR